MILRANKQLVDAYVQQRKTEGLDPATIRLDGTHLQTLLIFADNMPFGELPKKLPAFAAWLQTPDARRDGKNKPLALEYQRKCLSVVKHFLEWLADTGRYPNFTKTWMETFQIKAKKQMQDDPVSFTLDEIIRIAMTPVKTLVEERIRAACVFLFLSGMRITAFLTMSTRAVNFERMTVSQIAEHEVDTKLDRQATTKLLHIPDSPQLLDIVRAWDKKIRQSLPPDQKWFAPISPRTGELDPTAKVGENRVSGFRNDLIAFLKKASVEYKSSHKFRHGHIGFLRDFALDQRDLEAIANNVMQSPVTMIRYYGRLNQRQVHDRIDALCQRKAPQVSTGSNDAPDPGTILRVLEYLQAQQG